MKKILAIVFSMLLLVAISTQATAQKQYRYGYRAAPVPLTSALTVSVTPVCSFNQYELTADTNVTINVVKTYAVPGDQVSFKIKGNTRNRTITLGTNIEAAAQTITANKTLMYLFVYNGTYYYLCGSGAVD